MILKSIIDIKKMHEISMEILEETRLKQIINSIFILIGIIILSTNSELIIEK